MAMTNAERQRKWRAAHPEEKQRQNREYWARRGAVYNARKRKQTADKKNGTA